MSNMGEIILTEFTKANNVLFQNAVKVESKLDEYNDQKISLVENVNKVLTELIEKVEAEFLDIDDYKICYKEEPEYCNDDLEVKLEEEETIVQQSAKCEPLLVGKRELLLAVTEIMENTAAADADRDEIVEMFKCNLCEYESKYQAIVERHVRNIHKESESNVYTYQRSCNTDIKENVTVNKSKSIDNKSVNKIRPYKCNVCKKRFKTNKYLKHHKLIHSGEMKFHCTYCDYKTDGKRDVAIHFKKVHGDINRFKCPNCEYQTNHKGRLREHLLIHGDIRPFECNVCNKRFRRNNQLKYHGLIHFGERKFDCVHCDYKTTSKPYLVIHLKEKHSDVKAYGCHKCKYQTNFKDRLKQHLSTHENVKPYVCEVCNRRFRLSQHLESHSFVHSEEKRFYCAHCDYKCNHKASLIYHLKNKHLRVKDKEYKCSKCPYQTNRRHRLAEHFRRHIRDK